MLVKSYLMSKDSSLWSSGICTVFYGVKLSMGCSLCRNSSLKGLRMLVKSLESWYVGDTQNETMDRMAGA